HVQELRAPRGSIRRRGARACSAGGPHVSEAMYYRETRERNAVQEYDRTLVWIVVVLLGLGVVMVYSSSIAIAEGGRSTGYQPTYYLVRHALFVAVSVLFALLAFQVPMRLWQ